jgi:hypothetical protein
MSDRVISVLDPDSVNPDLDPGVLLNSDPDPDQGCYTSQFVLQFNICFDFQTVQDVL